MLDVVNNFKTQLKLRKLQYSNNFSIDKIENLTKIYVETLDNASLKLLQEFINARKEYLIEKKEIDCSDKFYCTTINYFSIINNVYQKFFLVPSKKKKDIIKIYDTQISKFIRKNYYLRTVEQFVKIKQGYDDINLEVIYNWARTKLGKLWWHQFWEGSLFQDIVMELINLVIDKLDISDWENRYKQISSYLEYYLRYAALKVTRLEKPIDIPLEVISDEFSNKEEKSKWFKRIYNDKEGFYNIQRVEVDETLYDENYIDTSNLEIEAIINIIRWTFQWKKSYFADIFVMYYLEGYTLKEIWAKYGFSAELIRQKLVIINSHLEKILKKI